MIRPLSANDLPAVTAMVKRSFAPALWPYLIYTQHGVSRYLEVALRHPRSVDARSLLVATDGRSDEPVGFADFKIGPGGVGFLSYICVDSAARGRGFGTAMFDAFVTANPEVTEVQLDTFRENAAARALYERWGFIVDATSAWISRTLPPPGSPSRMTALAVSLAAHELYGFCEFNVASPEGIVSVGRIGETVLRCFSEDTFQDDAILGGLRGAFGRLQTAFAVIPEAAERELVVPHDVILLSDRMSLNVGGRR